MDINIQLQVTDQELEEFPEEHLVSTTNGLAEWSNPHSLPAITHSPVAKLLTYGNQTLIQLSVHGKQTLIHPSVLSTPVANPPK